MENNGNRIEDTFREKITKTNGSVIFKGLDNSEISFEYDAVAPKNSSNRYKADVIIYKNNLKIAGFSVKTINGKNKATILNKTSFENLQICENRTNIDMSPLADVLQYLIDTQKSGIYLHEIANVKSWKKALEYFMFDGTATRNCDNNEKAEFLVDIDAKTDEVTIITKEQAIEHVWHKLKAERRSGNQIAIRY